MNSRILMIADIVRAPKVHDGLARVCGLSLFAADLIFEDGTSADMVPEDELSPVMLTPEILVAAGFKYRKGCLFSSWTFTGKQGGITIDAYRDRRGFDVLYTRILGRRRPLNFVHELQNLMRHAGYRVEADTMLAGGGCHEG